jgi:hypothetical protein
MFDINLLSEPGIQSTENVDCSISFIKTNSVNSSNIIPVVRNKKVANEKSMEFPSVSLYTIIFIAIVGVIFYPMLSSINPNISLKLENISQEVVIDKILKIMLQSKNDYVIESLQFRDGNVLISLTSFDMTLMKFFQEEMDFSNSGAMRIFGDNHSYSMIAKFPWEIISNDDSIRSPETFFQFVNTGKNVQTFISENEIAMRGSTSDIISIFLQLTNAEKLQSNEMIIHSIDTDSLIFAVKLPN